MNPLNNNTKPNHLEDGHESDDSSDFFSPISLSFFQPNARSSSAEPGSLPRLHDTSWIGARLSPIRSFDNDDEHSNSTADDDEEQRKSSIKVALQYDDGLPKRNIQQYPSEHSSLLQPPPNIRSTATSFHPRYTAEIPLSPSTMFFSARRIRLQRTGFWICSLSLLQLIVMLIWSWKSGDASILSNERYSLFSPYAWMTWWRPGDETLLRCGALAPTITVSNHSYWRLGTAICMSTSLGEWAIVCLIWVFVLSNTQEQEQMRKSARSLRYSPAQALVIYVTAVVTGELWTLAWDDSKMVRYTFQRDESEIVGTLTGGISWGTCGVLCATGILQPHRRFPLFSCAILLTAAAWLQQPYNCFLGTLGASYFGWALAAANIIGSKYQPLQTSEWSERQRKREWWSATLAIFIWLFPLLWISLS
ncbi:hypothetical protein FisN_14Hh288 [Fistulifera solaris]|jgi:hypothetical protein|uniref:Uncharacterized protein n=1 Tax=Fistulifera solaris TaxID=1519565 RepID=A0A1Z5KBF5_FISSO|nr:hypothetical protein FisN_14Hh288 [Fistulifera solaris]|eukprot:GAX23536.1 hypothetical protein FisN_14Hh288 [Fistulifera solaris]